jgi:hypothetical protein
MYCTAKSLTVIYIDGHDNIPDIALLPSSLIKKYDQETSNKDLGSQQTVVSVNKLDLLMNYVSLVIVLCKPPIIILQTLQQQIFKELLTYKGSTPHF